VEVTFTSKCEEAIKKIELARAEVEWEYPIDYAAAFDVAIECIKKCLSEGKKEYKTIYCKPKYLADDLNKEAKNGWYQIRIDEEYGSEFLSKDMYYRVLLERKA